MSDDCRVEELGHTSEVGLRLSAATPETLYCCAARAMFDLLQTEVEPDAPAHRFEVHIAAQDRESLMVDWLSELLYLHETEGIVLVDCRLTDLSETSLLAVVEGSPPKAPPYLHIKAVTYHQIAVEQTGDGWAATVYFDI